MEDIPVNIKQKEIKLVSCRGDHLTVFPPPGDKKSVRRGEKDFKI